MSKKILFTSLAVFFLFCPGVFLSAEDVLVQRYLNAANDRFSEGDYERAFNYINNALGAYKVEELPQNIELLAENIYYTYLGEITETRDWAAFQNIKTKLAEFDFLSTERIARRVRTLNTMESQDSSWGPDTRAPAPAAGSAPADSAQAERERQEREALERELEIRRTEREQMAESLRKEQE
ncbi:MAG: hypothetical protein LBR47_04070, partial [Spirochaetaceae bacterium]|nr:hypothetical protein [Spirochaetaceae bacterium]